MIVLCIAICAFGAGAAQAQKIYGQIGLTQLRAVPVNTWAGYVCASSPKLFVNVNHLRWTLRRHDSKLRLMPGMPANCRRYIAPKTVYGWDRITVTYHYHGDTYVGETQFYITHPVRP
jgi:hypothetical protein